MSSENRCVMVTGASGNLGKAVTAAFAERGARLVLLDRQADALSAAFGDAQGRCADAVRPARPGADTGRPG